MARTTPCLENSGACRSAAWRNEFFLQVQRERGERSVVGKASEDFRDVATQNGRSSVADFLEPLAKLMTLRRCEADDSRGNVSREDTRGRRGSSSPARWNSIESSKSTTELAGGQFLVKSMQRLETNI